MSNMILEIAAYACLVVGVALLVVRLAGERLQRAAGIFRFRLKLRKLDGVPAEWTKAMGAMEHLQDEPVRRDRPAQRRQQHPGTSDQR